MTELAFPIVLNGGDSDLTQLELPDLPEQLDHHGTPYTLRRDEHGEPSRDITGRYRYFWIWPKTTADATTLAGHTTTERQAPHPPTPRNHMLVVHPETP